MTFQLQIDKNSFQFHIIYMGMNPLKKDAATAPRKLSRPSAMSISTWTKTDRKLCKRSRTQALSPSMGKLA
jgi:hypothetical protein